MRVNVPNTSQAKIQWRSRAGAQSHSIYKVAGTFQVLEHLKTHESTDGTRCVHATLLLKRVPGLEPWNENTALTVLRTAGVSVLRTNQTVRSFSSVVLLLVSCRAQLMSKVEPCR